MNFRFELIARFLVGGLLLAACIAAALSSPIPSP